MILYFANRTMDILGHASTNLPEGFVIIEDLKTEEIETGVATFSCKIGFEEHNREQLEEMTDSGNYILRKNGLENEFYTIIDTEIDTKNQEIYVYAEDAGLDLLNEIAEAYEATEAHTAEWYVEKWIKDSGFEIGINEIPASSTRKLSWDGESTVTERLASIATQFDGFEASYSYDIKGTTITNKYVNIYKKRGKDNGAKLRLNCDIDRIVIKKSVANIATALHVTGGTPENAETPITLKGYVYDDGDFWIGSDGALRSREANRKWSRYVWNKEPNRLDGYGGHIFRSYSYDTTSQATLLSHAIRELKRLCEMEVNYEVDINKLPDDIKIGDRIDIIDNAGGLYLSSRILLLETSVTDNTQKATIGEHLITESGISLKVEEMAAKLAEISKSAEQAKNIAENAKTTAETAKSTADTAFGESESAQSKASEAQAAAQIAMESSSAAQSKADEAQAAVAVVEEEVSLLQTTVNNAKTAADNAQMAAETAQTKADEAKAAAQNAQVDASTAENASDEAKSTAENAISQAASAEEKANTAKSQAAAASQTAEAAKAEATKAIEDIANLGKELDTVSQTMSADYARKTELTEATANLQTQITQNAAEISSTASQLVTVDETANSAATQAAAAQEAAQEAQIKANIATSEAEAAQEAADEAKEAANAAQAEADNAKTAASTAKSVADKAEADLVAAKADLAEVTSRVDATEEDIETAKAAVNTAQTAADKAKADAAAAAQKATVAQTAANTASSIANSAQETANTAYAQATAAQKAAEGAQGDATAAQEVADNAKATAQAAQSTANTAKTKADKAQADANAASDAAAAADALAKAAEAKAAQAASDLATAEQNLAAVTSRVGATEAEIDEAQTAVIVAQKAANDAATEAAAAQATADTAKANAVTAQTAANNAKTAADNAQKAADNAQDAADAAQAAVDSLTVRVTSAETKITQNSEKIALTATKQEVATTLSGYYTKSQTDSAITLKANEITSEVRATYSTKEETSALSTRITQAEGSIKSQATSIDSLGSRMSTVEQTAEGLTVSLQETNTNVSAAKSTADAAKTAAANAQSTANTANSTANTAKTNAATAQNTANTARTEAANATKTATNYLNFSSKGLVIGDMTASTLGKNVLIDSENINIRSGSTILASFGAEIIELGRNSSNAIISLCGGNGTILFENAEYDPAVSALKLQSESCLEFDSGNFISFYAKANGSYAVMLIKPHKISEHAENIELYSEVGTIIHSGDYIDLYGEQDISLRTEYAVRIDASDGVIIRNNQCIYSTDVNGTDREIMRLNEGTTPTLILGDGLYSAAIGMTNICAGTSVRLITSKERVHLENSSNSTYSAHFRPNNDAKCTLGTASKRWHTIYASNSTIQTSDRREKENIMPLGNDLITVLSEDGESEVVDLHSALFDRLQPVQYNFINGNKKMCYGLIAQDVIEAMRELEIGEDSLDLVHHEFWNDSETGETTESFGIAYTNLIAMLIYEVQKLKTEIATLKVA